MPVTTARRVALLVVAAVTAVAVATVTLLAVLSGPHAAGPLEVELGDHMREQLDRQAEDELLRERLGGLAALVTDDDALAGCTDGHRPVTPPPSGAAADPVQAVLAATEQLRQLRLDEPVDVRWFDDAEMTERVAASFGRRWDDDRLEVQHRTLTALAAIGPDVDLRELRVQVFAEQVSGYFAGSEGEIGLRTDGREAVGPLERTVLAHEFEHALTDARLGRPRSGSADAARAASAVVEGSAALTMLMYAETVLTSAERERLREELLARAATDDLAGYSPYLRAELRFPYVEGLRYACQRWRDGGWDAVNDAFQDPPPHTAAVLFPQRHAEPARQPDGPGEPGPGWDELDARDFGAAQLEWLVAAPGGDPDAALADPRGRAGAWAGGELVVWDRDGATAVGLALVDRGGGPPLCDTMRAWHETVFVDDPRSVALTCDGAQVRLGIGPTAATASAIAD